MLSELSNWTEYTKVFLAIYALVSPPIVIPFYLGVVAARSNEEKRIAALVSAVGFITIMVAFVWAGTAILGAFGITLPAFRIAGGFLLLLISLELLRANPSGGEQTGDESPNKADSAFAVGLVPLAIPILSGPGSISAIVLLANDHDASGHKVLVSLVVVLIGLLVFVTFLAANQVGKLFTPTVSILFGRVMGLIICAIAFEFILDGVAGHFPDLRTIHDIGHAGAETAH